MNERIIQDGTCKTIDGFQAARELGKTLESDISIVRLVIAELELSPIKVPRSGMKNLEQLISVDTMLVGAGLTLTPAFLASSKRASCPAPIMLGTGGSAAITTSTPLTALAR